MEEVLAKYFSDEANNDKITFVNNWKSESESNAKEFFDAKTVWLSTQQIDSPSQDILRKILGEKPKQKQVFWKNNVFKYGVAASIVAILSLVFLFSGSSEMNFTNENLADGSLISLHDNSTFEIINFNKSIREIKVSGKAYFDIERDENRPFVIHTDNATVKVLGTSFVIDTYKNRTEVSVESGVVELFKLDGNESVSVKLEKGEIGLVSDNNKGIIKGANENLNYLSWKTKVLTFNNSTMQDVANTLEDVYGISVDIENQDFKNCRLTAKFNKKRAKDALEIIARTFNVEFELNKGKAIIKGKGC
jgi:transmembrane sensor